MPAPMWAREGPPSLLIRGRASPATPGLGAPGAGSQGRTWGQPNQKSQVWQRSAEAAVVWAVMQSRPPSAPYLSMGRMWRGVVLEDQEEDGEDSDTCWQSRHYNPEEGSETEFALQ